MKRPGVIVGIVVAILAVTLWRLTQPVRSHDLRLTQVTFDPGLTGWPAISPDGKTIAYASDRDSGKRLDLYVQQIQGGSPTRLIAASDDESEVAFSPDGKTLAFHSTKAGGGIYTVPVAGGEIHLVAAQAHTPRYSPDGRWLAYHDAQGVNIVASTGGNPRRFHAEMSSLRAPAWSPNGSLLMFWSQGDLWVAPLENGKPESTGLMLRVAKAGLGDGPFEDALWTAEGFLFSARTGFVRNLYRCPLDSHGKASGDVVRLTNGTELIDSPAVSHDGRIVFSAGRQRFDIWGLPLDVDTGQATGPPYRITDSLTPTANPAISADGGMLLYGSSRNGYTQVWQRDLTTGKESVAASGPEGASYGRLTASGHILCVQPSAGHNDVYLLDPATGQSRKLASGGRPWDVDPKEEIALLDGTGIDGLDLRTGQRVPVLRPPAGATLSQASFSSDGRWILFLAASPQGRRIYTAPARGLSEISANEWLAITDGAGNVDKPRFAPDGGLVYFTQDHEGARGIQAIRVDRQSGHPLGEAFSIFEESTPRLSLFAVNPLALELGVARDKVVAIFSESSSSIWLADLVPTKE